MVTLGLRPEVEVSQAVVVEEVNRQVAEIVEAAEAERALREERPVTERAAWAYAMPFAGVRYYTFNGGSGED